MTKRKTDAFLRNGRPTRQIRLDQILAQHSQDTIAINRRFKEKTKNVESPKIRD